MYCIKLLNVSEKFRIVPYLQPGYIGILSLILRGVFYSMATLREAVGKFGPAVALVGAASIVVGLALNDSDPSVAPSPGIEQPADVGTGECMPTDYELPDFEEDYDEYGYREPVEYAAPAVDSDTYEPTMQGLRESTDFETSSTIINELFGSTNVRFIVGEAADADVTHQPDLITQRLLDVSLRHVVEKLPSIPKPVFEVAFEDGVDIYLSTDITHEGEENAGLLMGYEEGKRRRLYLGLDPEYDTGETFMWAFTTLLSEKLCAPNGKDRHPYTDLNPDDFAYVGETAGRQATFYEEGRLVVANDEGMIDAPTDFQVLLEELLRSNNYWLSSCRSEAYGYEEDGDSPICGKIEYILGQIADRIDEDSAKQLAHRLG